jgi:serine-type D-Ala-D-Ala carboxypeptidase/endopeptidase
LIYQRTSEEYEILHLLNQTDFSQSLKAIQQTTNATFSFFKRLYQKNKKMKPVMSLLTISVLVIFSSTSCQKQNDLSHVLSVECDSLLASEEIRAISVGILANGKAYAFHKGKLINGKSPTNTTLYEIASLTKTFTGALLAKAISDKKIGIDDDIRKHLPDSFPNLEFDDHPISYRHLVTHTSGLPNMFPQRPEIFNNPNWDELPYKINKLQEGYTKRQFIEELHHVKLDTIPGFKFGYSNTGANVLGYCLERVYNRDYNDLVKSIILEPLKMDNTHVGISKKNINLVAKGLNVNSIEMPMRAEKELNAEGGIISSLIDMIKYMRFQLQKDNSLIQISHQELFDGKYGSFENGLFWQIFKNEGKPTKIFQNGGAYGTSSWMTLIPESQIGVFIVTNVSGPEVHRKLNTTADNIIKHLE